MVIERASKRPVRYKTQAEAVERGLEAVSATVVLESGMDLRREFSWGRIRPWTMADAPSVFRHANNPNVARYMSENWYPYSIDKAVGWLSYVLNPATPDHSFAIEVGGEPAGSIGLILSEKSALEGEVGYWLGERFWGRGVASDATRAMVEHAFTEHGLERLVAVVFSTNLASVRVLEKAGFKLERVEKAAAIREGVVLDDLHYRLAKAK